jgi:hypothetical protein
MAYQNLINFSVHPSDINRFENKWEDLQEYVNDNKLDGVELLIGYDEPENDIPKELVKTIHLPFWVTWLDVWKNGEDAVKKYYPNIAPDHLKYCCGGFNQQEMIKNQKKLWDYAALFQPKHAVMHAAHVELEHAFSRDFTYTNLEVLENFASLLNRTAKEYNSSEPPINIAIENLWWPGLDLLYPAQVDDFASRLEFDNWSFLLDTGHLMNTNIGLRCEDEAVDYVLERYSRLSKDARDRMKSIHLNLSLSGEYQTKQLLEGLPEEWEKKSFSEKYTTARNHVLKIDQHLAFKSERVRDIIHEIKPEVVIHEFITKDMNELSEKLHTQMDHL